VCFQPRTERFEWQLRVVPAGTSVTASSSAVFEQLSAGRRTGPPTEPLPFPGAPAPGAPGAPIAPVALDERAAAAKLDLRCFLQFISDAETSRLAAIVSVGGLAST
jgi:hypothetical protein